MKNLQPIEKRTNDLFGLLDVHSVFYTIQGEGPFAGQPAVFIRLAGCNLQCPLCDTDYTSFRLMVSPDELLEEVKRTNVAATLVVITGGEPFRQNLSPITRLLRKAGYRVQVETNGTIYQPEFPYEDVTVVCSPKAGSLAKEYNHFPDIIAAFKYVLQAGAMANDGLPFLVLDHSASPKVARPPEGFNGPVYLQPADEGDDELNRLNQKAVVESCKQNGYTLGIQIHKFIGEA